MVPGGLGSVSGETWRGSTAAHSITRAMTRPLCGGIVSRTIAPLRGPAVRHHRGRPAAYVILTLPSTSLFKVTSAFPAIGLKPLDIEFMKRLHEKVNIIPLIAKADTLTPEECQQFKKQIMREIQEHKIKIYEFPETDDEEENKIVKKIKDRLPLAVVGSNTIIEVNGKRVRGRQTHMQDLKDVTNNVHYENYRSRKLAAVTYNGVDNNKSKGQLTKFDTVEGM
ncbi:hypothetical protein JZ751_009746 [Albula glossodonta]|uniref:Septin-type G domain-containing protein n=1 Tax=Albula glossodonta TaxID=121402 RepID=A0A8T2P1G3_9TELE|nr:hypothetical protein JZ751_009746 [Albula glossodonta]